LAKAEGPNAGRTEMTKRRMLRYGIAAGVVAAAAMLGSGALHATGTPKPDAFTLTSADFQDNGPMETAMAATGAANSGGECGGQNVSPALAWSHAPANTKSFALTMFDPDGGAGMGVSHWVAYDIPSSKTAVAKGEMSKPGGYVGGKNNSGTTVYRGPCPPVGDAWHHYVIQVFALDIAPGTLGPDLTRDEFLQKIKGKVLGEAGLIARYTR
jgi:Raf kinase inhibitor-like YbhB/YbcL family protein